MTRRRRNRKEKSFPDRNNSQLPWVAKVNLLRECRVLLHRCDIPGVTQDRQRERCAVGQRASIAPLQEKGNRASQQADSAEAHGRKISDEFSSDWFLKETDDSNRLHLEVPVSESEQQSTDGCSSLREPFPSSLHSSSDECLEVPSHRSIAPSAEIDASSGTSVTTRRHDSQLRILRKETGPTRKGMEEEIGIDCRGGSTNSDSCREEANRETLSGFDARKFSALYGDSKSSSKEWVSVSDKSPPQRRNSSSVVSSLMSSIDCGIPVNHASVQTAICRTQKRFESRGVQESPPDSSPSILVNLTAQNPAMSAEGPLSVQTDSCDPLVDPCSQKQAMDSGGLGWGCACHYTTDGVCSLVSPKSTYSTEQNIQLLQDKTGEQSANQSSALRRPRRQDCAHSPDQSNHLLQHRSEGPSAVIERGRKSHCRLPEVEAIVTLIRAHKRQRGRAQHLPSVYRRAASRRQMPLLLSDTEDGNESDN
ncbi:unnamed protein product [Cyprideis torosa]|uniref:Uncharacterized protein n=1 Tax=Cyprideis torosa TaxID=163714 RepID=A0A7R8WJ33_9CRUS|nr:unnamed protein product [Cyprideis torosa]CAG0895190.1 unnamed protein product [Cyprideis torosa]